MVVAAGTLVAGGCFSPPSTNSSGPIGIQSFEDFEPFASPPGNATLTLAAVPIQVSLKPNRSGDSLMIVLTQDGRVVDKEEYVRLDDGIGLIHAAGETFRPPVPLLKFPMQIGDEWAWKGDVLLGDSPSAGRAKIRTLVSKVAIENRMESAVEVDVDLEMGSDGSGRLKRSLKLWFVKHAGVVRRSFGEESVREPR